MGKALNKIFIFKVLKNYYTSISQIINVSSVKVRR